MKKIFHAAAFVVTAAITSTICLAAGLFLTFYTGNVNLGMSFFVFGTVFMMLELGALG